MKAMTQWKSLKKYGEKLNNNSDYYYEKYTKIKFNSDYNLFLRKTLNFHEIIILVRFIFEEGSKYYPHVFL